MKKEIKNYVFVKNGEILSEFGTFSSRFTTSPSRPLMILFPLTILAFSVIQDMYHMGRMVRLDIWLIAAGTTWAPPSSSGHLQ